VVGVGDDVPLGRSQRAAALQETGDHCPPSCSLTWLYYRHFLRDHARVPFANAGSMHRLLAEYLRLRFAIREYPQRSPTRSARHR